LFLDQPLCFVTPSSGTICRIQYDRPYNLKRGFPSSAGKWHRAL